MGETADGKFMNFCGLKGTYSDSGSKYYGKIMYSGSEKVTLIINLNLQYMDKRAL